MVGYERLTSVSIPEVYIKAAPDPGTGRVMSRNLKLGGYRKMLRGGNMRSANLH